MKSVTVEDLYERFYDESFDKHGVLKTFRPIYEENFNFAYDVVDEIARLEPNRRAMIWCNDQERKKFLLLMICAGIPIRLPTCSSSMAFKKAIWSCWCSPSLPVLVFHPGAA